MEHNRCKVSLIFSSLSSNAYLFIYLLMEKERGGERNRGTCAQHASHFDLAYDREFLFFFFAGGGGRGRYEAGPGALPEMS